MQKTVDFKLQIHTGDDAVQQDPYQSVATILEMLASRIRETGIDGYKVYDENGNCIGGMTMKILVDT